MLTNRIKELAIENGYNIASLEKEAGLANGSIRRWDSSSPSGEKLLKIANILNCSVDYLLTGKTATEEPSSSISMEDEELLGYYHSLSKTDQRWIMGQMIDLIKKYDSQAEERQVSGK